MNVITATGDEFLNQELRKIDNYNVIGNDIFYREGILEILEINNNINLIILSNKILGEISFENLIEKIIKIKNIEIIIFLTEKNDYLENYLISKKIIKIYYLNNNGYELFLENIQNKNKLEKEIKEFKKIILSNKKHIKKIKLKKINNIKLFGNKKIRICEKICLHNYNKNGKVIVITGVCGSGKTIVSKVLTKIIKSKNKTVFLLNLKNKKLDTASFQEIKNYIKNIKENYDYLIIDLLSEFNQIKTILYCADKIIFLIEPNLSEIEKSQNILDLYLNDFEINVDKIKILFNKVNKYKIAESILEEIFEDFEIIGEVKYDEKYNLNINKNKIEYYDEIAYEKIYQAI